MGGVFDSVFEVVFGLRVTHRFGGQYHLQVVVVGDIEYLDNLAIGYRLVGIEGYVALAILLGRFGEPLHQLIVGNGLRGLVAESDVVVVVLVDYYPGEGPWLPPAGCFAAGSP